MEYNIRVVYQLFKINKTCSNNNIKLARLHYVDDICYVFKIKNQTDIKNGQLI